MSKIVLAPGQVSLLPQQSIKKDDSDKGKETN